MRGRQRCTTRLLALVAALAVCCTLLATSIAASRTAHSLFSNRPTQHASKYIKAIEPLAGFHITHGEEATPLPGFHPDAPAISKPQAVKRQAKTLLATNEEDEPEELDAYITDDTTEFDDIDLEHWSVGGAPHSYHKGQAQLYPDTIQLKFTAFGEQYDLEMYIMKDLFNEHSRATMYDGDRVVSEHRHVLQSYWSRLSDGSGWATATLHRDGKFQAVIHRDGDTIQVDPVEVHQPAMASKAYRKLHTASHRAHAHPVIARGLVVHRHSDMEDLSQTHMCGSIHPGEHAADATDPIPSVNVSRITHEPVLPYTASARRLLQQVITQGYGSFPTSSAGIAQWTPCYFGDKAPQRITIGFAVDTGMYQVWGSVAGIQQYIAWEFSVINLVYLAQMNVFLTISDMNIQSTLSSSAPAWNDAPPSVGAKCTTDITSKLYTLSAWRGASVPTQNSLWNLQTNCYPPSGTVGLAWVGVICGTYYGTSITTYYSNQWLSTAHEIGHNFGAAHTFQLGQGSTGGIMDYGNGLLNGIYQFNTVYSQSLMCPVLNNLQYSNPKGGGITPYCYQAYSPTCGNGVVEPGEACDDKSSCCGQPGSASPCQLTSGSQCSGETPCCSKCKYLPSSTTCLGGKGYCQNGFCAQSTCTGYSGMSFCNMVSTNPCRQQCLKNGVCSDAYSSPNLNVPDGTVCATAPYSTCSGGVCVASGGSTAVKYDWQASDWSTCDCSGQQTRQAYCLGSDGSTGTSCNAATKPTLSQTCAIPASCVTYSWTTSAWGTCSVDCGGGVQTASVQCISSATKTAVADASCTGTKPVSTRSCNTQACPTSWVYSLWSACTKSCGSGTSTRTAICQQLQNSVWTTVDATKCPAGAKQALTQSCNTQACTTYSLTYGNWNACSVSCGGGTQSRPVTCTGSDGKTADLSMCGCSAQTCPGASQLCNTAPCPTYAWKTSDWSTCTLACGGGVQTRTVQCISSTTGVVADTFCSGTKPSGVMSCNTQACAVYTWQAGTWQACSKSCGGGIQSRTITCVDSAGKTADVSKCTAATKPPSSATCNAQACPVYQWLTGSWSTCSAWCGGGTQTRTVRCVVVGTLRPTAYSNCDTSKIPATAQYCNQDVQCPLNSDTQWQLSDWSDCSNICGGGGVQNRQVTCRNATTGAEVDPAYCPTDYIPEIIATCANVTCPTHWFTSDWSACSAPCDGGSRTRRVECRYVDGTSQIDAALCTGTKPADSEDCNLEACPKWVIGEWGPCSARCGEGGVETRPVTCVTASNQNTTADQCAGAPMPVTNRTCTDNIPCPHWHRGPWSECSAACGSGTQTREVQCRMPLDWPWHGQLASDESLCPPAGSGDSGDGVGEAGVTAGKPLASQSCNTQACPTHYWSVEKYDACSVTCGGGTQTGTLVCKQADGTVVDQAACLSAGAPPSTTRTCATDPCPTYTWQATSVWSNCSVTCGEGVQTRLVNCTNTSPPLWLDVPFDIVDDSLCDDVSDAPPASQPCSFPTSACWANGGSTDRPANGLCTTEGTCLCRAGWAGTYCDETPRITNVQTNGPSYVDAGIPFGDTLRVTWDYTGSLPYVSVLLLRTQAKNVSENWAVASYIAKDIVNTGAYSWSVGHRLDDLESGDGFIVRVWFSPSIQADTASSFTIADPCSYKSCGVHGTCGIGGVCQCVPGYSGELCNLGPCERAQCSTSYGSCNNADYIGKPGVTSETVGVCLCGQNSVGFFDGYQCRSPPGCTPKCRNGGDLFNVIVDLNGRTSEAEGQCGNCGCTNAWTGDECETCGLKCFNGGKPNADCSACDCSSAPGFFGSSCACKYYTMQLQLDPQDAFEAKAATLSSDPIANARFARTLAIDLALASGQATGVNTQVNVVGVTVSPDGTSVSADVQFGLECPTLSADFIGMSSNIDTETAKALRGISTSARSSEGQAFLSLLSPHTRKDKHSSAFYPMKAHFEVKRQARSLLDSSVSESGTAGPSTGEVPPSIVIKDGRPDLLSVYQVVAHQFEDLSSPIYRGVVTSSLSRAIVTHVSDPTNQDSPASPGLATDPFVQAQNQAISGPTSIDSSSGSAGGLSTGAIVGIVVGVIVGVLLFALVGFLAYRYWHEPARKAVYSHPNPKAAPVPPAAGLATSAMMMESGTEMAVAPTAAPSPGASPLPSRHTTPPQQLHTLLASPSAVRVPSTSGKYTAAPVVEPQFGPARLENIAVVHHHEDEEVISPEHDLVFHDEE